MKKPIYIPGFKGGQQLSLYDPVSMQTFKSARNLDVLSETNILRPFQVLATITQPSGDGMTDYQPVNIERGADGRFWLLGTATIAAATHTVLHSSADMATWRLDWKRNSGTSFDVLEEFKDGMFFGHSVSSTSYLKRIGNFIGTDPTFTVTIASPGVFTSTAHGLLLDDTVIFATTGALPTGLTAGTLYYVISAGLGADTFQVSTTRGGSAVNTSGSQSGTHTIVQFTKTITSSLTGTMTFLRAHKGLGKIFFIHDSGRKIGWYDNSTVTLAALTLDADDVAVGIEPWGRFCKVGVRGTNGKSRFLIWDGENLTIDDLIPLPDVGLQTFRIIDGETHYIMGNSTTQAMSLKYFIDGDLKKDFKLGGSSGGASCNPNAVDVSGGNFLFGFAGATYTNYDQVIWQYGTGQDGYKKILTPFRTRLDGSTTDINFLCIKQFADRLVVIFKNGANTVFTMEQSGQTFTVNDDGVYESGLIPLNGGLPDKLSRIIINHEAVLSGCGFTVQIKHVGHYPWGNSVPSADSYQDLITPEGSGSSTGKTQSTDNAVITEIAGNELFKETRYIQLKIKMDEMSGTTPWGLVFPIILL